MQEEEVREKRKTIARLSGAGESEIKRKTKNDKPIVYLETEM